MAKEQELIRKLIELHEKQNNPQQETNNTNQQQPVTNITHPFIFKPKETEDKTKK